MSAVHSQRDETKETELIGISEKAGQLGSARRWTTMLSVIEAPLTALRKVLGQSAQVGGVARLTTIIGLVAALIGIPPGISKLVDCFSPYNLEVSAGKELTITYNPRREVVEVLFNVRAEEFGAKANQILSANAWVEQAHNGKLILNTSRPEFEENQNVKYQPIIPNGANPKNMSCSIVFRLDDRSREVFQCAGLHRLVVEFKGKDRQVHQVPFCFYIEESGIELLFNSEKKECRYISEDPMCSPDQPQEVL